MAIRSIAARASATSGHARCGTSDQGHVDEKPGSRQSRGYPEFYTAAEPESRDTRWGTRREITPDVRNPRTPDSRRTAAASLASTRKRTQAVNRVARLILQAQGGGKGMGDLVRVLGVVR